MSKARKIDYIQEPTEKLIRKYIKEFNDDKENAADEKAVQKVFETFDNSSFENVLIKTVLLNNRYSAGLCERPSKIAGISIDVYNMSYIISEHFKECYDINDVIKAIDNICSIVKKKNKNKPYSFLSKYYFWTCYSNGIIEIPIYDRYVRGMIYYLGQKCDYLDSFKQNDINSYMDFYKRYIQTLKKINEQLNSSFTVREFDKYLWQYAKDLKKGNPEKASVDIGIY